MNITKFVTIMLSISTEKDLDTSTSARRLMLLNLKSTYYVTVKKNSEHGQTIPIAKK